MKLTVKGITLKKDTLEEIKSGEINTDKFVQTIRENLDNANHIIETKLLALDDVELYDTLSKVFQMELEEKDILGMLKQKYGKHYTGPLTVTTTMVDENGNNIVLVVASSKKGFNPDRILTLDELRKLANSYDIVVLDTIKTKLQSTMPKPEPFEDYQFGKTGTGIDSEEELFDLKARLLRSEIRDKSTLKKVLNQTEQFVKELIHQAKSITKMDENEERKRIAALFRKAYEENFNNRSVFVTGSHKRDY